MYLLNKAGTRVFFLCGVAAQKNTLPQLIEMTPDNNLMGSESKFYVFDSLVFRDVCKCNGDGQPAQNAY
jgi:hypothetical protein